jgi:hypothetical protein
VGSPDNRYPILWTFLGCCASADGQSAKSIASRARQVTLLLIWVSPPPFLFPASAAYCPLPARLLCCQKFQCLFEAAVIDIIDRRGERAFEVTLVVPSRRQPQDGRICRATPPNAESYHLTTVVRQCAHHPCARAPFVWRHPGTAGASRSHWTKANKGRIIPRHETRN